MRITVPPNPEKPLAFLHPRPGRIGFAFFFLYLSSCSGEVYGFSDTNIQIELNQIVEVDRAQSSLLYSIHKKPFMMQEGRHIGPQHQKFDPISKLEPSFFFLSSSCPFGIDGCMPRCGPWLTQTDQLQPETGPQSFIPGLPRCCYQKYSIHIRKCPASNCRNIPSHTLL